jgi:hypothetical protein
MERRAKRIAKAGSLAGARRPGRWGAAGGRRSRGLVSLVDGLLTERRSVSTAGLGAVGSLGAGHVLSSAGFEMERGMGAPC